MRNLFVVFFLLAVLAVCVEAGEGAVWFEGEAPLTQPTPPAGVAADAVGYSAMGWGNTEVMSGGKVLQINISAEDATKLVPEDGLVFGYAFTLPAAGKQNLWARIGYEWVRSRFEWRIDRGAWQVVEPTQATATVQPVQSWCELGWLKLAGQELAAGKHEIEFRYRVVRKDNKPDGKPERVLSMLDCVLITPDDTVIPQGKAHPEEYGKEIAGADTFKLPVPEAGVGHALTPLNGLWQIAAWDDTAFVEASRLEPDRALPDFKKLYWQEYRAPGAREEQRPELGLAHRFVVRTKVDVPAELQGRGFYLDMQRSCLFSSVFVNGKYVGWSKTFHAPWQMDLSGFLEPGKVNELAIVFKDAYYSLNVAAQKKPQAAGWRWCWNLPADFVSSIQSIGEMHDFPVTADVRAGILEPVSIAVCGNVYTEDVFCQTSVKEGKLKLEVTAFNPGKTATTVKVENAVRPWNGGKGGETVLTLPAKDLTLQPGERQTFTVEAPWKDAHLWWPDDPYLYQVKTTLVAAGKQTDLRLTRFGFREWDWKTDHMFRLNGVKWPMWSDIAGAPSAEEFVRRMKEVTHLNQVRLWCKGGWWKMTRRQTLEFFDETGVAVRSSGTFDGQLANYGAGLREEDMSKPADARGNRPFKAKTRLFDAWREQMNSWIKAERNHPSIYIWSVENEVTFINILNLGMSAECEPEIRKGVEHVMRLDPTRPAMIDGGNCLKDESLPVNGAHYTELYNSALRDFPDAAYERERFYDKAHLQRNAWRMVPGRPIMKGEILFAEGYTPERLATIGGDQCFIGVGQTMQARGLFGKMLSEGYRWSEVSSFYFWMGSSDGRYWNSWNPVAVFSREWNWTFGGGEKVRRTLKVFNSTHDAAPITASWELALDGKKVAGQEKIVPIPAGEAAVWDVTFDVPAVTDRTEGQFILKAIRNGKEVFRESKEVSVLDLNAAKKPALTAGELAVFDPQGQVKAYLQGRGIAFTNVESLEKLPAGAKVLLIGKDALSPQQAVDSRWQELTLAGLRVLVFDQKSPLSFQAIPADLAPTNYEGRVGFSEDLSHPVFAGLQQKDFFTWGNDHVLYRNAYKKGTRGGRSLVQVDNDLACTALEECPSGEGVYLLCQLAAAEKLKSCAPARRLIDNALNYLADYKPLRRDLSFCPGGATGGAQETLLKESGLVYSKMSEVLPAAGAGERGRIALVSATPENLQQLAQKKAEVEKFCAAGNWLVLWGLTPEGLSAYNQVVGVDHVIRPFERERVLLSYPLDPLASGLTLKDVVMDTGKALYPWMALREPDNEEFAYVVDYDDVAPFCRFPTAQEMNKGKMAAGVDQQPRNMVNGFTSDDNWCFTYTTILDEGHKTSFRMELPKATALQTLRIRPSKLYHPLTKVKVFFDDDSKPIEASLPVRENPIGEDIQLGGRTAKSVTIEMAQWQQRGAQNIVVVDNLWLLAQRDEAFTKRVKSLLNVGGLLRYNVGSGGIVLCQVNLPAQERNPGNRAKKINMVSTILKNLGAGSGSERVLIAGAGLRYEPVRLPDSVFTAYATGRGKPGWFNGGREGDFGALPVGEQKFARTDYFLSDFSTSPVPTVLMTGGPGSEVQPKELNGLKVGRKAEVLFFLHTFNPGGGAQAYARELERVARDPDYKIQQEQPWVFQYVVHYSDGSTTAIPVVYLRDVGNWLVTGEAAPLPGAALAWSGEAKKPQSKVALYSFQWNNPNPQKEIVSIDLQNRENGKFGTPAVFAITTGVSQK